MEARHGQVPGRLPGDRQVPLARPSSGRDGRFYTDGLKDARVALSIKNVEAERLARDLAKERGTTVIGAIIDALEDALRRTRGRRVAPSIREAILEISHRCAALPDIDTRATDEILGYDERGAFR